VYLTILLLHSLARWAVLAGLGLGLFRAYRGWLGSRPFTQFDDTVRHTAATVAHVQLLLGYTLYFVSPLVAAFHLRGATHAPTALFFGIQHVAAMTTAIVVLTIGSALAKRQATDPDKFRTMALWFTVALLLILVAIPWPFSPWASRPYFRP
jgi:membrane protein DedA with SNARE-associated domain